MILIENAHVIHKMARSHFSPFSTKRFLHPSFNLTTVMRFNKLIFSFQPEKPRPLTLQVSCHSDLLLCESKTDCREICHTRIKTSFDKSTKRVNTVNLRTGLVCVSLEVLQSHRIFQPFKSCTQSYIFTAIKSCKSNTER